VYWDEMSHLTFQIHSHFGSPLDTAPNVKKLRIHIDRIRYSQDSKESFPNINKSIMDWVHAIEYRGSFYLDGQDT
jgi:hypothetical protein